MKFFNDTDLFVTGTRGTRELDLPDADVILIDNFSIRKNPTIFTISC